MKKCIVISDSFKGSLPSRDICAIARERIPLFFPACEVRALNVADGGEGTVDCFLDSCGGERVLVSGVQDPYGEPIDAAYGLLPDGTAVIEMAAAAGLPLVAGRKNPCVTTTYGVGQLIADAPRAAHRARPRRQRHERRRLRLRRGAGRPLHGRGRHVLRSRRRDARPHRAHRRLRRARKASRCAHDRHVRHHQSHARP